MKECVAMKYSRRELPFLLATAAAAQTSKPERQPSRAFRYEDLAPIRNGAMTSRQILTGLTHSGFKIDLHETELAAGQAPHDLHRHIHEEMVLVREGELEVTIAGRTTRIGAGSAAFIASNEMHGWRNPGGAPARYFVFALGDDDA
jgi:quercetin dioxygenase-like cupin family protein